MQIQLGKEKKRGRKAKNENKTVLLYKHTSKKPDWDVHIPYQSPWLESQLPCLFHLPVNEHLGWQQIMLSAQIPATQVGDPVEILVSCFHFLVSDFGLALPQLLKSFAK